MNESIAYKPDSEYDMPAGFSSIYSVVPADYEFPDGIQYVVIYEVFIQNTGNKSRIFNNHVQQLPEDLYKSILEEALAKTGYAPLTRAETPEWQPSARFRFSESQWFSNDNFWDDTLAIPNLSIYIWQGTALQQRNTDENGDTGLFDPVKGEVNYQIQWDNDKFILWDGETFGIENRPYTMFNAGYDGKLDVIFTSNDLLNYYRAGAFRALYAYYHETLPGMEALVKRTKLLNVALFNSASEKGLEGFFNTLEAHPLKLWAKINNIAYYSALDAMSTTFHELGHASHYEKSTDQMVFVGAKCRDSWANGVAYAYMKSFFPRYEWNGAENDQYTRVVECLMNNGYSLDAVQHGFYGATSWDTWCANMKEQGVTDSRFVDLIFAYPNNLTFNMSDVVGVSTSTVCMGAPVWFDLKNQPAAHGFSVSDWGILETDSSIRNFHSADTLRGCVFSTPGIKTIRTRIQIPGNTTIIEENTVQVLDMYPIKLPTGKLYTFNDITFGLQLEKYLDPNIKIVECWLESTGGRLIELNRMARTATFQFYEPGKKTVKFELEYPGPMPHTEIYESTITVDQLPAINSFSLQNPPESFAYGEQYVANYKIFTEPISEIVQVNLCHNTNMRLFDFTTWRFNYQLGQFRFNIPYQKDNSMDYTVSIWYTTQNGSQVSALKRADIIISNIR